jgi:hypothetical protein
MDKAKWGTARNSTDIRRRWQLILMKFPAVIGVTRRITTPFEAWYCFIGGEFLDNTIQHTGQHNFITQQNVSRASDAQLTDESDIKVFIGVLMLSRSASKLQAVCKNCGLRKDMTL